MKINYDATVDALSVTLRKGKVDRTVEIAPEIMIDFDMNGRLTPKDRPSENPSTYNSEGLTPKDGPSENLLTSRATITL